MPPLILHAYPASPKPQSIYDADESLSPEKGLRAYYYPTTTRRQCSTHAYNGGATRGCAVRCGRGVGVGASTKHLGKHISLRVRGRRAAGGPGPQPAGQPLYSVPLALDPALADDQNCGHAGAVAAGGRALAAGCLRLAGCQSLCAAQPQAGGVSQGRRPAGPAA